MFQGSNTDKLDLAVELDTDRGRSLFLDLVAVSDVVIDNFSPAGARAARASTRTCSSRATRGSIVLRAPAYGVDGAVARAPRLRADHRGAGRASRGPPASPTVVRNRRRASPTHSAARTRRSRCCSRSSTGDRTGRGMFLECPMVGASLNLAAEQVVEYSAYGRLLERLGNRSATCVPQGVYRTADVDADGTQDRWVAALGRATTTSGARSRTCSASPTTRCRRAKAAAHARTRSTTASPTGARRAAPTTSCARSRARAFPANRSCAPTSTTGSRRWSPGVCSSRSSIRSPVRPTTSARRSGSPAGRVGTIARARRCSASTTATCSPASSVSATPTLTSWRPTASSVRSSVGGVLH